MLDCGHWRLIVVTVVAAAGCAGREAPPREFSLRGQILAVRSDHELLVKHDEIKGFMPAMTMPYQVRDRELMRGRTPGDVIDATVAVSDTSAWLTRIEKVGTAPIPDAVPDGSPGTGARVLAEGEPVPDAALVNQRGDAISISALRGTAVAITFIYTRCPLPQYCPLLDRRFADVQRLVQADAGLRGRVRLISVSFDPDADTPAVLSAHANKLGADPHLWHFATAAREIVDPFAASFGVSVMREADQTITHNMRTAVIDADGRVAAIHDGTEWTPGQIVADLRRALPAK